KGLELELRKRLTILVHTLLEHAKHIGGTDFAEASVEGLLALVFRVLLSKRFIFGRNGAGPRPPSVFIVFPMPRPPLFPALPLQPASPMTTLTRLNVSDLAPPGQTLSKGVLGQ